MSRLAVSWAEASHSLLGTGTLELSKTPTGDLLGSSTFRKRGAKMYSLQLRAMKPNEPRLLKFDIIRNTANLGSIRGSKNISPERLQLEHPNEIEEMRRIYCGIPFFYFFLLTPSYR